MRLQPTNGDGPEGRNEDSCCVSEEVGGFRRLGHSCEQRARCRWPDGTGSRAFTSQHAEVWKRGSDQVKRHGQAWLRLAARRVVVMAGQWQYIDKLWSAGAFIHAPGDGPSPPFTCCRRRGLRSADAKDGPGTNSCCFAVGVVQIQMHTISMAAAGCTHTSRAWGRGGVDADHGLAYPRQPRCIISRPRQLPLLPYCCYCIHIVTL